MARPWWPSRSTSTSPSCFNFVAGRRSRPRPCSQVHRGTHSVASDTCLRGSSTRRSPPPRLTTSHRGSPRRRVAGDPPHHLPFFPAWSSSPRSNHSRSHHVCLTYAGYPCLSLLSPRCPRYVTVWVLELDASCYNARGELFWVLHTVVGDSVTTTPKSKMGHRDVL
jgi:hypothetical protein